ncbi:MAG: choice-of-anchor D domain-containing protein [Spirochaetota bacterium]|nr:MAG: choice-of-anchor D domain-containing protein [Spirochaetota bacterium]
MNIKDKLIYPKILLLPLVAIFLTTCSIIREDIYRLASTSLDPIIEVVGYPNETGFFDFGSVNVYTSSFASFTIMNSGGGILMIKGITFVEDDVEWFTIDSSTISSAVMSGKSTVFTIKFKPTDLVSKSATVIILSNCNTDNPYTFVISGIGSGVPSSVPDINLKQGTTNIPVGGLADFGNVQIGDSSSKVFTIENLDTGELSVFDVSLNLGGGTITGEFSLICPTIPTSLAQDEDTQFTVVFTPKSTGIKSATVSIANDDPDPPENPYTFGIQGDGVALPTPDINIKQGEKDLPSGSGSYNFGYIQCGSSSQPAIFAIENTGTATLNITSVTLTAGFTTQFSIDTSGMDLAVDPGSNTTFKITFSPQLPEEFKWATVTIVNDDTDEDPYTFNVEGWGVIETVPDINVLEVAYNSDFDFGPVPMGDSKTEIFTIENTGTGDLNLTSIENKDPDKFMLEDSMTVFFLLPGDTTIFEIIFTPIETKSKDARIEIYCDDPDENPYKFDVFAYGSYGSDPDINVKQGTVSYMHGSEFYFPDTMVGQSSEPVVFTVENNGTADLEIQSILLTGGNWEDFSLDYDLYELTLLPGASIMFTTWFVPTKDGKRETKIQIVSNDPDEERLWVKLIGLGI